MNVGTVGVNVTTSGTDSPNTVDRRTARGALLAPPYLRPRSSHRYGMFQFFGAVTAGDPPVPAFSFREPKRSPLAGVSR